MNSTVAACLAVAAAVAAWFAENAAIHAMGYVGFGGAGWITAITIPLGAAAWVWGKCHLLANDAQTRPRDIGLTAMGGQSTPSAAPVAAETTRSEDIGVLVMRDSPPSESSQAER
jgi:hypothetical protein